MAFEPLRPAGSRSGATLFVSARRAAELRAQSAEWPSWTVAGTQLAELESLVSGVLSPAGGYAARGERSDSVSGLRLPSPVLELTPEAAQVVQPGRALALRDPEG